MHPCDYFFMFLIFQHSHDKYYPSAWKIQFHRLPEPDCRVFIVRAVRHKPWFSADNRKSPRPLGPGHPLAEACLRHRKTAFFQAFQRFQGQNGIFNLILPRKTDFHFGISPIVKPLPFQTVMHMRRPACVRNGQGTAQSGRFFPDHFHNLRLLHTGHGPASLFENACLMGRDPGERLPQKLRVIPADGSDHRRASVLHDIGSIQQSPHARFQHHNITLFFPEIPEAQRGLHLKRCGMGQALLLHPPAHLFYQFHALAKGLLGNRDLVYPDTFPFLQCRGGKAPHPAAGAF